MTWDSSRSRSPVRDAMHIDAKKVKQSASDFAGRDTVVVKVKKSTKKASRSDSSSDSDSSSTSESRKKKKSKHKKHKNHNVKN